MPQDPRWTLVTGASSGIGAELARAFAASGRSLVLVARRLERLEELAAELRAAPGVAVQAIASDLAGRSGPEDLIRTVEGRGIVLDTLVNNAGFGLKAHSPSSPTPSSSTWWSSTSSP